MNDAKYLELCNKYFQPLDEIAEALENGEGLSGLSYEELTNLCTLNHELKEDLEMFYNVKV